VTEAVSRSVPAFIHLVLYDGTCGFCDRAVRWLLDHDPDGVFRYAPLQGDTARSLRARHPEIPEAFDTVVYVHAGPDGERVFLRSEAIFRIFEGLGGGWRHIARLRVVPRVLTDFGYLCFAKIRYAIFGRIDECRIPTGAERERFLD
jgi:predicted DCC family thiol-disulfide oxidoreductase YuxK